MPERLKQQGTEAEPQRKAIMTPSRLLGQPEKSEQCLPLGPRAASSPQSLHEAGTVVWTPRILLPHAGSASILLPSHSVQSCMCRLNTYWVQGTLQDSHLNSGLTASLAWTLPAAVTVVQGSVGSRGPWNRGFKCVESEVMDEEEEEALRPWAAVLRVFYSRVPEPHWPSPRMITWGTQRKTGHKVQFSASFL